MSRGEMSPPAVWVDEARSGVETASSVLRDELREVVQEGGSGGLECGRGTDQSEPIDRFKNRDIGEIFGGYPAVRGAGFLWRRLVVRYHWS